MRSIIRQQPLDNTNVNFKLTTLVIESDISSATRMFGHIVTTRFKLHQKQMRLETFLVVAIHTFSLGVSLALKPSHWGVNVWLMLLYATNLLVTYYEHKHLRKIYDSFMRVLNDVDANSFDFLTDLDKTLTAIQFDTKIRELEEKHEPKLVNMIREFRKLAAKRYCENQRQVRVADGT